jgi:hypothetical protein
MQIFIPFSPDFQETHLPPQPPHAGDEDTSPPVSPLSNPVNTPLTRILCTLLISIAPATQASQVVISEVMYNPAGTKAEWIELTNQTTNRLDTASWQLSSGANLTLPDFNAGAPTAHLLLERERIVLSSKSAADTRADYPSIPGNTRIFGPWTGSLDNAGENVVIVDKNGHVMSRLEYGDGGRKWPAAPDGTGHSLVIVNENREANDWHNWKTSPARGGTPGTPDVIPSEDPISDPTANLPSPFTEVIPMTATWDYYKELAAPAANWNSLAFVPTAPWASGPALLGFETAALPAPGLLTGFGSPGLLTYYFRKTFNWTGGAGGGQFQIDTILDDGATYFINGTYIGNRDGVTSPVHNSSIATVTVGEATLTNNGVTGVIPPGVLVDGVNVLAAVSLQVNTTSSDMVFGSNLRLANAPPAELLINEVRQSGPGVGFIEFYNPGASGINLNGYFLTDTAGVWNKYPITQSVVVPAGGLATLGFTESGFAATALTTTIYLARPDQTPFTGLSTILPQDGRSVGRKPAGGATWFRFSQPTPGQPNASTSTGGGSTAVPAFNEVHFNTTTGNADWVEFTNTGTSSLPVGGLFVASTKTFTDKVPLSGSIPAGGFVSFDVNFPTDNGGDLILYLIDSNDTVLAEAEVERRTGKTSTQVWPRGSGEWYASAAATRNGANLPDRNTSIVMTEIMYAPVSDHRQGEFIELYNRGPFAVNLGGWELTSGVDFIIPAGTVINPGQRIVIAQDAAYLSSVYPGITGVIGNFGGTLSNGGELIRLEDASGNLADEVDYHTGGDWSRMADGLGSSLELINPQMDNDCGSSWAASNESQKGEWTNFTYTGTWYNLGSGGTDLERKELHFNLVGDSHVILRNITFGLQGGTAATLTNAISPTNSGVDGWRVTGTHWATFANAEGLNIVADGGGDMKGNAIELDIPALTANQVFTISFQARWVSGLSRLVMNTWDRTWGRTFAIPVPNNCGTPGAPNSRAAAAAAPEIWSMLHSPPVPRTSDNVIVTAKVTSALPLASVNVSHRLDSITGNNPWSDTAMNDAGTGGDALAGDGIYSATIGNYRTEGAIVQFYIQAAATGGGTTAYPVGGTSLPGLWIVDSTPVTSDLLTQRFVMSEYDRNSIGSAGATSTYNFRHPRMSNHYYNATLIFNEKEITYNIEARKSGSPWTRSGSNDMDRVRIKYPKDRMFRGREKSGDDNDASLDVNRRWNNRVNRYWLYLVGYQSADAEFVQVQFNNLGLALKDDTEPTDTDMLDRSYGDSGSSEFHEVDDAWYFGDSLTSENRSQTDGNWVVDPRFMDSAVYWMGSWPIRTMADKYDFSPLTSWIRTMYNNGVTPGNSTTDDIYRASVENQFDVDKFARYAAVRAWAGSWDNFTINRGKNGYVYRRPADGRWEFHYWDGDLDFANTGEAVLGGIGGTGAFFGRPWFRRQMNYYLQEIRDKWSFNSPRVYAWLQAMEDQSPSYNINQDFYKSWFQNRRGSIDNFIGAGNQTIAFTASASVGANTSLDVTSISGTVPSTVTSITVDGQPWAVVRWLTASNYQITGVTLKLGTNALTLRAWDRLGPVLTGTPPNQTQLTVSINVNKTGNAPPVLTIVSDPQSMNAGIGETVIVDVTGSYDPEGTALAYNWTIAPLTGVSNSPSGATGRRLVFSIPGIYTVTLGATDAAGIPASITREITVFSTTDFYSFGSLALGGGLTATNVGPRDNTSPVSWYSLEDFTGQLRLQITEAAARPLDSNTFPSITRPLPSSSNWVLQTNCRLETRHHGEYFNAGLMLDVTENGVPVRYVYSLETGDQVLVRRDDPNTVFYTPGGGSLPTPDPIRINTGGPQVTETDNAVWAADSFFLANPATTTVTQTFDPTVGGSSQHYGIIGDSRRSGISGGNITYEVPVPVWPSNYNLRLYSSNVSATSLTISMNVNLNDAAGSSTWSANSSNTIMRVLSLSNVARNPNGTIKINVSRNASTTAGVEAGISGIEILPMPFTGGSLPPLPPAPMQADALRVQRAGNSLIFSRKVNGVWFADHTQTIPAGTTAVKGGIFASTETPQNLLASFDYLLVSDPASQAAVLASLRLTEVMYHSASGGLEYLEFRNTGAGPINLQGVSLPATQPFAAYTFGNEPLAPGEFIVLTNDPTTFRAQYGSQPRLALTQWASGSLDNAGEHVVINDPTSNVIHDFTYDDALPWPVAADGQGPSLEVIDVNGDYNNPLNWRASDSPDGTPGGLTRIEDADTDGDGVPDWVESAFGLPPNSPGTIPTATSTISGGQITISWPFAAGRSYRVERSPDLLSWQNAGTVTGGSFTDSLSLTLPRLYYRVFALP